MSIKREYRLVYVIASNDDIIYKLLINYTLLLQVKDCDKFGVFSFIFFNFFYYKKVCAWRAHSK